MPMPPQGAAPTNPQAAKNAMMLQAIKAGAMGGASAPPAAAMMGQAPMSQAAPPVNPSSLPGAGMPQQQMAGLGQPALAAMQQQNPIASALMSPIPGGQ